MPNKQTAKPRDLDLQKSDFNVQQRNVLGRTVSFQKGQSFLQDIYYFRKTLSGWQPVALNELIVQQEPLVRYDTHNGNIFPPQKLFDITEQFSIGVT